MPNSELRQIKTFSSFQILAAAGILAVSHSTARAQLVINPTFTSAFNTDFGADAAAAQAAWISAAQVFQQAFNDPITVNITVDAVTGSSVFAQSSSGLVSTSYGNFRTLLSNDAKTTSDITALGTGGSFAATDPTGGSGTWWATRAQAKAIGLIPSDGATDGTTKFGAGNAFTFAGPIAPGTYDFRGVAAHEISEVLGRLGLKGQTLTDSGGGTHPNSYSLLDSFSYTGPGVRSLAGGPNSWFSINAGTTQIKQFNDWTANSLDSRDWAVGAPDSFNQFAGSGVVNPVSQTDLQVLDVIGYDLAVPEASTYIAGVFALVPLALSGLRKVRG